MTELSHDFRTPAPRDFYDRSPQVVARQLLGRLLIRSSTVGLTAGIIVETEAYLHRTDPACHSYRKRTRKNASMYGPPGHAYVYPIHAKWCFNVVTQPPEIASAVLIRALEPVAGIEIMRARRGRQSLADLASGPAKLCQALAIDRADDGNDLVVSDLLFISRDRFRPVPAASVSRSGRIGVTSAHDLPLRFFLADSPFVSAHRRADM
jgi:DNA-3-methyladenine glycosylase